uniref:BTB domain-containing protein n=1 Tax=Panagrellus redivivus TaxID=6233 RepID=A0A7E4W125_PANRE
MSNVHPVLDDGSNGQSIILEQRANRFILKCDVDNKTLECPLTVSVTRAINDRPRFENACRSMSDRSMRLCLVGRPRYFDCISALTLFFLVPRSIHAFGPTATAQHAIIDCAVGVDLVELTSPSSFFPQSSVLAELIFAL